MSCGYVAAMPWNWLAGWRCSPLWMRWMNTFESADGFETRSGLWQTLQKRAVDAPAAVRRRCVGRGLEPEVVVALLAVRVEDDLARRRRAARRDEVVRVVVRVERLAVGRIDQVGLARERRSRRRGSRSAWSCRRPRPRPRRPGVVGRRVREGVGVVTRAHAVLDEGALPGAVPSGLYIVGCGSGDAAVRASALVRLRVDLERRHVAVAVLRVVRRARSAAGSAG